MSLLEPCCEVDDFCQTGHLNHSKRLVSAKGQGVRHPGLRESEIMTLVMHFHQAGYPLRSLIKLRRDSVMQGQTHGSVPASEFVRKVC